jgi:hypothetical protein
MPAPSGERHSRRMLGGTCVSGGNRQPHCRPRDTRGSFVPPALWSLRALSPSSRGATPGEEVAMFGSTPTYVGLAPTWNPVRAGNQDVARALAVGGGTGFFARTPTRTCLAASTRATTAALPEGPLSPVHIDVRHGGAVGAPGSEGSSRFRGRVNSSHLPWWVAPASLRGDT